MCTFALASSFKSLLRGINLIQAFWLREDSIYVLLSLTVLLTNFHIEVLSIRLLLLHMMLMSAIYIVFLLSNNGSRILFSVAIPCSAVYIFFLLSESVDHALIVEHLTIELTFIACNFCISYKARLITLMILFFGWIHHYYLNSQLIISSDSLLHAKGGRSFKNLTSFSLILISVLVVSIQIRLRRRSTHCQMEKTLHELEIVNKRYQSLTKQLKEQLAHKEDFILCFSHETRNPMNSILGNLELASKYSTDLKVKEYITNATISGKVLLQLLNNILDTGKIQCSSSLDFNTVNTNVREALQKNWEVLKTLIQKKNLNPALTISNRVPKFLKLDSHRLSQILLNLINNSIKFTHKGTISVHIDFLQKESISESDYQPNAGAIFKLDSLINNLLEDNFYKNSDDDKEAFESLEDQQLFLQEVPFHRLKSLGEIHKIHEEHYNKKKFLSSKSFQTTRLTQGYLKIEVFDTGCGIGEEDLLKLFARFSKRNEGCVQRNIGAGLGLWVTYKICELMGGGIRVFSKKSLGASFVLLLKTEITSELQDPLLMSRLMEECNTSNSIQDISLGRSFKKALVVEDNPYNQEISKQFLLQCGIDQVDIASDGLEGVTAFSSKPDYYYSLITMDLDMPNMGGKEACRKIRETEKCRKLRSTPIVIITGHATSSQKEECLQNPILADLFLAKPISITSLSSALDSLSIFKSSYIQQSSSKLMCVNYDLCNLKQVEDILAEKRIQPLYVQSSDQAVQELSNNQEDISIILVDCDASGLDEYMTTIKINQKLRSLGKSEVTHIYGITHKTGGDFFNNCKNVGMKELLLKPITPQRLRQLLISSNKLNN